MDEKFVKCCEVCAFFATKKSGTMLCEHVGFTIKDSVCKKFSYDASKRIPKTPTNTQTFTEEDFSIE